MSELSSAAGKRTPLFPFYPPEARIVEFGGWLMPVQFSGILKEHEAVRATAGLFDVSHMGEIKVTGPDAKDFLQRMVTADLSCPLPDRVYYALFCNESGGTVDDLLVYPLAGDDFLLVVNAANTEKDFAWLRQHAAGFSVDLEDVSAQTGQLALQGPNAEAILRRLLDGDLPPLRYYRFIREIRLADVPCLVSRTGYTGEDGFEFYCRADEVPELWRRILDAGRNLGLLPIGLGARDTLRLEAGMPLYGHELSPTISPVEAGLERFIAFDKEFLGSDPLRIQAQEGPPRRRIGLALRGRSGVPRHGYPVGKGGTICGAVTSGAFSPTLRINLCMALVSAEAIDAEGTWWVEIRGERIPADLHDLPFYRRR